MKPHLLPPSRCAPLAILTLLLGSLPAAALNPECPGNPTPSGTKLSISPSNPQYFRYKNKTLPLIGASAEYLCHVRQPGSFGSGSSARTPADDFCEYTNYPSFMTNLSAGFAAPGSVPEKGLNTLRLWISLNSSPGLDRMTGNPYPHEAPFPNCLDATPPCATPAWNLSLDDPTFYDRLQCVLDFALSQDILVEITIFDPWQGNPANGPWKNTFSSPACFASRDYVVGGLRCDAPSLHNDIGWAIQKRVISTLAGRLCAYPNIYYEIANEADFIPPVGFSGLTPMMIRSWHQDMLAALAVADSGCSHLIAENFNDNDNLTATAASFSIVNTHYTETTSGTTFGANELLRARHNGGAAELNKAFGFNETKYVTDVLPLPPNNPFQTAQTARAEAWEFLTSEGAIYDLYGERWQNKMDMSFATLYLKYLNGFLDPLPLDRMSRSLSAGGVQPSWLGLLPNYGATVGTAPVRWGAMQSPMTLAGDADVLYIHHSNLQVSGFRRYVPVTGSYTENLQVKLPAGTYRIEWIDPASGTINVSVNKTITAIQANLPQAIVSSHTYSYDVALRVTRL